MMALGKGVGTRYPEQAPRAVERLGLRGEMRAGMRAEQHQPGKYRNVRALGRGQF